MTFEPDLYEMEKLVKTLVEGTASTTALRWELACHFQEVARRPVWMEKREGGRRRRLCGRARKGQVVG